MGKKLYVGNLTYQVSSSDLEQLFSQFGSVQSTRSSPTAKLAAPRVLGSWRWAARPKRTPPSRGSMTKSTRVVADRERSQAPRGPYHQLWWWRRHRRRRWWRTRSRAATAAGATGADRTLVRNKMRGPCSMASVFHPSNYAELSST